MALRPNQAAGEPASPSRISISARPSGSAVDVHVAGELDADSSRLLDEFIRNHERSGTSELRVDLRHVSFMDAAAVGTLVRAARRAGRGTWRLSVTNARGLVRRVAEITQLDAMIDHWQNPRNTGALRAPAGR